MSNITLSIGGRDYTVACAEGEGAHITDLGAIINAKLTAMGSAVGQSEVRQLLFACLLLADELHETRKSAPAPSPAPDQTEMPVLAPALERIADRIENLAEHLETRADSA